MRLRTASLHFVLTLLFMVTGDAEATVYFQSLDIRDLVFSNEMAADITVRNGSVYAGVYRGASSSYWDVLAYPLDLSDTLFVASRGGAGTLLKTIRSMAIAPSGSVVLVGDNDVYSRTVVFDDDGTFMWQNLYKGSTHDKMGMDVAVDSNSNLYVAVNSLLNLSNPNSDSTFVIKYDSIDGDILWLKSFRATSLNNRYSPKAVVAGSDGYVYVALEEYTKSSGIWYDSLRVYKFSANSAEPIDTSAKIALQDANNLIYDMVYVSCGYAGCGGSKVVLLTEDGIIAINATDMTTSSSIVRQGYNKISHYIGNWFAVAGPHGVGRFDVSDLSTPDWECTAITTYMDVAVTPVGGIVCVDTVDNDVRITHFPPNASECNSADTRITHDGGASTIDYPVAIAAAEGDQASNIYVFGNTDQKVSTMFFTVTSSLSGCLAGGTPYYAGDANGDGLITISDVVFTIAYIFSGGAAPSPIQAGDANSDGLVNISDVVYMISYIFSGGTDPQCGD